ncbi:MAG: metallophosphoesterase [Alphaproteobacteria bacterium]|nr:metallophosphoesterase [Alphaproteobacteria bacterium]MBU0793557.1 metallophosphoesterase [Alphaproteobacteria bacterium]MBU0876408.1 metallophosphoesterase [Alphaproteobacteria bacterium]MBU1770935.1 metallophosphoesterase [Alphaproteobacteria bacterium]
MQRRTLLKAAIGAPFMPLVATAASAVSPPDDFSFAFISDSHIRPDLDADKGCAMCFEQISASDYDFVIQGGDHIEDALEVSRERATMLMDLYQRVERRHLRKPVHHVLGNHDCLGVFAKSGIDPSAPDYGKQFYIDRFGPRYYAFDHKGVHFVVLDSVGLTDDRNYEGRVDAEQLQWLRADLAAQPKGTRIIVATHIPLVTAVQCYQPESWANTPHNWTFVVNGREVLRILRDYDVLAVLQGHSHVFEQIELNGIRFISAGAVAGADWRGSFLGTPEGYSEIFVSGRTVEAKYRTYGFAASNRQDVPI